MYFLFNLSDIQALKLGFSTSLSTGSFLCDNSAANQQSLLFLLNFECIFLPTQRKLNSLFPLFVCHYYVIIYIQLFFVPCCFLSFNFGFCAILWEKLIWTFKLLYENGGAVGPSERFSLVCFYLIGDLLSSCYFMRLFRKVNWV